MRSIAEARRLLVLKLLELLGQPSILKLHLCRTINPPGSLPWPMDMTCSPKAAGFGRIESMYAVGDPGCGGSIGDWTW